MKKTFVLIIICIILAACSYAPSLEEIHPSMPVLTETFDPTTLTDQLPSSTPNPTQTPMEILGEPFTPQFAELPDLILNLGPDLTDTISSLNFCVTPQTYLIFSQYPYKQLSLLHPESPFDENYPSWSPDGSMLSFVQSKPEYFYVDAPDPLPELGYDQISINGISGIQIQNSQDKLERIDFLFLQRNLTGFCEPKSMIVSAPVWSDNQNYLGFLYMDASLEKQIVYKYQLYILDINNNKMKKLSDNTQKYRSPIWLPEQTKLLDYDQQGLILYQILSIEDINTTYHPWPMEIKGDQKLDVNFSIVDQTLFVTFTFSPYQEYWLFNPETQAWSFLSEEKPVLNNPVFISQEVVVGINDHAQLVIKDLKNNSFQIRSLPDGNEIKTGSIHIFHDRKERIGISFWVTGEQGGLWITDPYQINGGLIHIIDKNELPDVSHPVPEDIYVTEDTFRNIIDYTWRP